jgi:hypothetical protein
MTSNDITNEPSGSNEMLFVTDSLTLNYLPDFDTGFPFFYSSSTVASVFVYARLNATGNLLATIDLTAQNSDSCVVDPNGCYYNWASVGETFARTTLSIDFEAELMRSHTKMSRLVLMTLEEDLQMFPNQQELC